MRVSDKLRLAWLPLHLGLIALVCLHESFWLGQNHLTLLRGPEQTWQHMDELPALLLGESLPHSNAYRVALQTYLNAAGIEIGYGYFAPNVPDAHALIFAWAFPDGHTEYDAPVVQGGEAELRLTSLIEQIGGTDYAKWRDEMIRRLAAAAWQRHAQAVSVRAFFGAIMRPTLAEFRAGKTERVFICQYVYAYDKRDGKVRAR